MEPLKKHFKYLRNFISFQLIHQTRGVVGHYALFKILYTHI